MAQLIKGDYALALLKDDGSLDKYVRFDPSNLDKDMPQLAFDSNTGFFMDNVGYIATPPPEIDDPTGTTGTGYDTLPHPHTKYCVANTHPELGEYVFPYDEVLAYVCIDGTPPFFSANNLHVMLGQAFDNLDPRCIRAPDAADPPRICIVLNNTLTKIAALEKTDPHVTRLQVNAPKHASSKSRLQFPYAGKRYELKMPSGAAGGSKLIVKVPRTTSVAKRASATPP